jgi:hypothetical protein
VIRSLAIASLCVACGPPLQPADDFDAHPEDVPDAGPDAFRPDARPVPFTGSVYVHSYDNLYAVDPETLEVTLIGPFGWPEGFEDELMTDIAVDRDGDITGISFGAVYAVDKDTAACTYLSALTGQEFNGLSWVPEGIIDKGAEVLIGTGLAGTVWRIDPMTGESTQIGAYGGAIESSGDIVSVTGFGTVATVKNGSTNDYLARIDESTGAATIIGTTGYPDIWGIGFWANKVFGFVATNQFVLIDVDTGAATYVSTGPENWAGAGVTTIAPIVD